MKKVDFKKLAVMGIAAGALLTTQSGNSVQNINSSTSQGIYLAGSGCGGSSGCGGTSTSNGNGNGNDDTDHDDEDHDDDEDSEESETENSNGNGNGNGSGNSCGGKSSCANMGKAQKSTGKIQYRPRHWSMSDRNSR